MAHAVWTAFVRLVLFSSVASALFGCAAGPRNVEAVPFRLVVSADANINPDMRGTPTPVVVRIYELKNESAFESADFFSLYEKEQAVLGGDLIQRDEVVLRPNDKHIITRRANNDARVIGVIAAFRNLERSTWKAVVRLPPAKEVSNLPVVGPYVTTSPREEQIYVQVKYQSLVTSQAKGSLF